MREVASLQDSLATSFLHVLNAQILGYSQLLGWLKKCYSPTVSLLGFQVLDGMCN